MLRAGTIVAVSNRGRRMRLSAIRYACATLLCVATAGHGAAPVAVVGRDVAQRACAALSDRVERSPAQGPLLLRSYDDSRGSGEPDDAVLRTAAFSYDNALAVIALLACDRRTQALRVGEALRLAASRMIRLRNAYRAGPVADKPLPNGWWDAGQKRWLEDAYQDGTATGNVAWAALALLALHDVTGQARWLEAARAARRLDCREHGGRSRRRRFQWRRRGLRCRSAQAALEVDRTQRRPRGVVRLARQARTGRAVEHAGRRVRGAFSRRSGTRRAATFFVGTLPDGVTANRGTSGLDVQLWPLLLADAAHDWRRALDYAEREHGVRRWFRFQRRSRRTLARRHGAGRPGLSPARPASARRTRCWRRLRRNLRRVDSYTQPAKRASRPGWR